MGNPVLNTLRFLILSTSLISLHACQTPSNGVDVEVRPGDIFHLSQHLEVLPNQTMLVVQHGRIIDESKIDYYAGHCLLTFQSGTPVTLKVNPGSYVIKQVTQSSEINPEVTSYDVKPGSKYSSYITTLTLVSATEHELQSLSCQRLAERFGEHYLAIEDINEALGVVAQIEVLNK